MANGSAKRKSKEKSENGFVTPKRIRVVNSESPGDDAAASRGRDASQVPMFCDVCHNILKLPDDSLNLRCTHCDNRIKLSEGEHLISVTNSAFIKDIRKAAEVSEEFKDAEHATIDEMCPKCNHVGLKYYTRQMRSVDEGSTVFYECGNCGFTFSEDN
eukprot:CAMPEP_0197529848 /NCGR_PEP_ID=MMETSP1318-20131121/29862_1 /TAXON_ID=552666 /ORGANISM="Partenskyella glossopodia, Strain RCC365" /LENGTH=157 /DNA_ID=CAMNT_0043085459 /DNA_START=23 /DNA_END=496 /DNA_ORIENTATION=+